MVPLWDRPVREIQTNKLYDAHGLAMVMLVRVCRLRCAIGMICRRRQCMYPLFDVVKWLLCLCAFGGIY